VNSGLPINQFCFEGFIPLKKGRQTYLSKLSSEERTMVFYESPKRLVKLLDDLISHFGPHRECSVSRELTKIFEETRRGSLKELLAYFSSKDVKGELVVVVRGREKEKSDLSGNNGNE
jgi:16S rRNA (cytidine1402-2'-O)-methyltransferase